MKLHIHHIDMIARSAFCKAGTARSTTSKNPTERMLPSLQDTDLAIAFCLSRLKERSKDEEIFSNGITQAEHFNVQMTASSFHIFQKTRD